MKKINDPSLIDAYKLGNLMRAAGMKSPIVELFSFYTYDDKDKDKDDDKDDDEIPQEEDSYLTKLIKRIDELEKLINSSNNNQISENEEKIIRKVKPENTDIDEESTKFMNIVCKNLKKEKEKTITESRTDNDYEKHLGDINVDHNNFKSVFNPAIFLLHFLHDELKCLKPIVVSSVELPPFTDDNDDTKKECGYTTIVLRDLKLRDSKYSSVYNVLKQHIRKGLPFNFSLELLDEKCDVVETIGVRHVLNTTSLNNLRYSTQMLTSPLDGKDGVLTHTITFKAKII
jgi:hypothetical protein